MPCNQSFRAQGRHEALSADAGERSRLHRTAAAAAARTRAAHAQCARDRRSGMTDQSTAHAHPTGRIRICPTQNSRPLQKLWLTPTLGTSRRAGLERESLPPAERPHVVGACTTSRARPAQLRRQAAAAQPKGSASRRAHPHSRRRETQCKRPPRRLPPSTTHTSALPEGRGIMCTSTQLAATASGRARRPQSQPNLNGSARRLQGGLAWPIRTRSRERVPRNCAGKRRQPSQKGWRADGLIPTPGAAKPNASAHCAGSRRRRPTRVRSGEAVALCALPHSWQPRQAAVHAAFRASRT